MRSMRTLLILLSIIAAVVIVVFVLTVTGDDQTDTTEPRGQSGQPTTIAVSPATPTAARPPTVDMFGNRLEVPAEDAGAALSQTVEERPDPTRPDYLSAAPARLQWQRIWDGAAVPVSGSDGPARIDAGVAEGFARTPQGAALAAMDAIGRAYAAPDPIWQKVVRERFYGGGDTLIDQFARSRASAPGMARYVTVPEGVRVEPGYRDDLAVVQLAVRSTTGYAIATWPMVWVDGDWRIRTPEVIETLWRPATPVASMAGFGRWRQS
ncbi:hypothetical protein [Nocardia ignorata]|uniref:DUF8175 domain-containing protein n=1 Tax=Nocardia ignorata TaxID=145285 RepID=A0A4R6P2U5_NOCIG|nr:hypothetical protein [Nocardia ignorata]TDP31585.1 hypothetical protein DFR75_108190 [Nocardia ignorata]